MFILFLFTSHLHAPLTQYHTNPSTLKKRLYDTDSRLFSFQFKFDPTLTRHHLQSSIVCNTVFFHMAKQVWAGVMKKVVVRQKKGRKEWESERDGYRW